MINEVCAAYNKDDSIRLRSSSGGMFLSFATQIINQGGVVYGVKMSTDCRGAYFDRSENIDDLMGMSGSKYIQAIVGDTYKNVKNDLDNGKTVLFTGTGCQVNGLKKYLSKDYDKLVLVDFICHGVPSRKLWEKYVKYVEEKENARLTSVNFRCKSDGWKQFGIKEVFYTKSVYIPKTLDPYMLMFLYNYCLRPSCYECYAKNHQGADITIGDFWGIEKLDKSMTDGNGTSLVIVRSEKGKDFFDSIKPYVTYKSFQYNEAVKRNAPENQSVVRPKQRDGFYRDLDKMDFQNLIHKYNVGPTFTRRIKYFIKSSKIFKNYLGGYNKK